MAWFPLAFPISRGNSANSLSEHSLASFPTQFYELRRLGDSLNRFGKTTPSTANLLKSLRDGCTGSYWFELAVSLVLLLANCLKEDDATVNVDLG